MIAHGLASRVHSTPGGADVTSLRRSMRQIRCFEWAKGVYGQIALGRRYQAFRFLEECCELAQAQGMGLDDMIRVAQYVSARKVGDVKSEIGDVMVGLNIMAENLGLSIDACETTAINHIVGLDPEVCREKDAAKIAAGLI